MTPWKSVASVLEYSIPDTKYYYHQLYPKTFFLNQTSGSQQFFSPTPNQLFNWGCYKRKTFRRRIIGSWFIGMFSCFTQEVKLLFSTWQLELRIQFIYYICWNLILSDSLNAFECFFSQAKLSMWCLRQKYLKQKGWFWCVFLVNFEFSQHSN